MENVRVLRVSENGYFTYWMGVTEPIQEMIGDCVRCALIKLGEDDDITPQKIMYHRMTIRARHIMRHYEKTGVIKFDGMDLKLKFKDGNTITFTNSGKGSISAMETKNNV